MSEEKQIEEMARIMEHDGCSSHDCEKCYGGKFGADCTFFEDSRALYDAGYRKQTEAEWITDEEGYVTCSNCGEEHTWDEFRPMYCDMCGARMKGGE